jgi:acyl-CoA thioesterase FadM
MAEKSIRYECTISRDGERIATGTVTVVCVGRTPDGGMKAKAIPPEIASRFAVAAEAVG